MHSLESPIAARDSAGDAGAVLLEMSGNSEAVGGDNEGREQTTAEIQRRNGRRRVTDQARPAMSSAVTESSRMACH